MRKRAQNFDNQHTDWQVRRGGEEWNTNETRQMEINDKIYCANSTPTFIPPRTVNFLINFNEFIRSMFCFGHCLCSFKNDVVAALFFFYIAVIVAVSRSLHCLLFSNTNYCVDVGSGVFATCIPFFA